MSTLRAIGLTRSYGGVAVVDHVDLEVFPGEVLGVIGPNGGGKSTLLLLLAGLLRPDTGTAELNGRATHKLALEAAGSIGLVTAQPGLYPALTGRENLSWFATLYGRDVDGMHALAEKLQLGEHLDRGVHQLSSGQQQKLSLMRALMLKPEVLLLDEPTANLDPLSARSMHQAMRACADAGMQVVFCTHDLLAADQICDRVAVMNRSLHRVVDQPGERRKPSENHLYRIFEASCTPQECA